MVDLSYENSSNKQHANHRLNFARKPNFVQYPVNCFKLIKVRYRWIYFITKCLHVGRLLSLDDLLMTVQ